VSRHFKREHGPVPRSVESLRSLVSSKLPRLRALSLTPKNTFQAALDFWRRDWFESNARNAISERELASETGSYQAW
jgi:hypothetical protein